MKARLPYATTITQADRVAAGARYLDRVFPSWWRHVRIRPLDLSDGCACVLGQLAGTIMQRRYPYRRFGRRRFRYEDATNALRLSDDDAHALGFVHLTERAAVHETYWSLTACWRAEIRQRRKATR